jgi:transcriptional regulator with XRE-family HTH domain
MVRIRALRQAHSLTAAEVVDRMAGLGVKVDRNSLYNIESGKKKPSARLLDTYARALGVHPLDVWQGSWGSADSPPTQPPTSPAPVRVGRRSRGGRRIAGHRPMTSGRHVYGRPVDPLP